VQQRDDLGLVRGFWDRAAIQNHYVAIYDAPAVQDPARREEAFRAAGERDAWRLAWFTTPDMRVLDLGCGSGRVVAPMARQVREVVGVDVSEEMLARARAWVRAANATFVRTDGNSLAAIAARSIDFAYSLLCLIHVDKQSAFRYLRELARVLVPDGLAHLQFQTLADPRGIAKFVRGLEQDMPLEFYGPEELPGLLAAAGLETLGIHRAGEYCFATVVNGSAQRWHAAYRDEHRIEGLRLEGFLGTARGSQSATLSARVLSCAAQERPFLATLRLRRAGKTFGLEAPLCIAPGSRNELCFELGTSTAPRLLWNGEPLADARSWLEDDLPEPSGKSSLDAGLLPPAQLWCSETIARFPGLLISRTLAP
jgi:SAM-dependent methyltransferase